MRNIFSDVAGMARKPFLAVLLLVLAVSLFAKMYEEPKSFSLKDESQGTVDRKTMPKVDTERLAAEDRAREKDQQHPSPFRFAVAADVAFTLDNSGTWQSVTDGRLWRLRIQSAGARSLNLGITRFDMSEGAKLWIYDPEHKHVEGPYTSRHRSHLGSLWTPIIEGEEIVVEVFVPTGVARPVVEIGKVNHGYRGLSGVLGNTEGTCEIDAICPEGNPWRDQIRAVGVYTISGTTDCSGTLLNDTLVDFTPYFLSANHCGVDTTTDASVVVYWNFQAAVCGTHGPGSLLQNQTGSIFRASSAPSDFVLFELSAVPDPSFHVFHAGWDRSTTIPAATVTIHHPRGDVKAISLANAPPITAAYLSDTADPAGTHWRTILNSGVLEHGSSGSCLFETTHGRCIGQLHGGGNGCPAGTSPHDW